MLSQAYNALCAFHSFLSVANIWREQNPNHHLFLNITTYGLNYKTQDEGHSDVCLDCRKAFLASLHGFIHSTFIPVSLDKIFPRKIKNLGMDSNIFH